MLSYRPKKRKKADGNTVSIPQSTFKLSSTNKLNATATRESPNLDGPRFHMTVVDDCRVVRKLGFPGRDVRADSRLIRALRLARNRLAKCSFDVSKCTAEKGKLSIKDERLHNIEILMFGFGHTYAYIRPIPRLHIRSFSNIVIIFNMSPDR